MRFFEGEPRHTPKDREDKREYQKERSHYSDKPAHAARSIANDSNGQHQRHWKKEEKKR